MELFEALLNKSTIYETVFFNIKSALEYNQIKKLKENNLELYKEWEKISKRKYSLDISNFPDEESKDMALNDVYQEYAVHYPEYCKIVGITYASVYSENNVIKRDFKKIIKNDEISMIETFSNALNNKASEGLHSTPKYVPYICGHNIINYDIPLFIKRLIANKNKITNPSIPIIFRKYLQSKPWDSNIIDTLNVWKFNGKDYASLDLVSGFMGLKKKVELMSPKDLSKYYWENIETNEDETLKTIGLQSATQTNLSIQFINELRGL